MHQPSTFNLQPGRDRLSQALSGAAADYALGAGQALQDANLARHIEAEADEEGARIIVLRLKRARNPDMVCLERLQHFLGEMRGRGITVLVCGVREDFAQALKNLKFNQWLPDECVFLEEPAVFSSTLKAIRRAYELLGDDLCPTCPRRHEKEPANGDWYYMI